VNLSFAAVQVALLFVPGIIWAMMDASHRPPVQNGQFVYTLRVFVFGVVCYSVVALLYDLIGWQFDLINAGAANWRFADAGDEAFNAVLVSIILGILWIAGRTHKVVTRFLNWVGATRHIADQDIWEFMFNSDDPKIKYAYVRDYKNELIYAGYIRAYSERPDVRELAMYEVEVFTQDSQKIYETPYMYLAREIAEVTIEFPVRS